MSIQTTYTKARANLASLCSQVAENREVVIISRCRDPEGWLGRKRIAIIVDLYDSEEPRLLGIRDKLQRGTGRAERGIRQAQARQLVAGHADHPPAVPAFRKLDAVAVLTARLLPAPRFPGPRTWSATHIEGWPAVTVAGV